MHNSPQMHYHLPYRKAGSFGTSVPGQIAEWLTTTWFRFGAFVTWWVALPFIMSATPGNPLATAGMLLVSPIIAALLYAMFKAALAIVYFIPITNVVMGYLRLGYIWLFSRIIVQEAPEIVLPVWSSRSP